MHWQRKRVRPVSSLISNPEDEDIEQVPVCLHCLFITVLPIHIFNTLSSRKKYDKQYLLPPSPLVTTVRACSPHPAFLHKRRQRGGLRTTSSPRLLVPNFQHSEETALSPVCKFNVRLNSASSDQQRETRRRDSGSSASQHEKPSIVKRWTHVAKGFGMGVCPWISESDLADALTFEEGQDLPEDHPLHEVVEFLNDWGVKDHERKHPQFLSNVSALLF